MGDGSIIGYAPTGIPSTKSVCLGMPPVLEKMHGAAADVWRPFCKGQSNKDAVFGVQWDGEPSFQARDVLPLFFFISWWILARYTFSHTMLSIWLSAQERSPVSSGQRLCSAWQSVSTIL